MQYVYCPTAEGKNIPVTLKKETLSPFLQEKANYTIPKKAKRAVRFLSLGVYVLFASFLKSVSLISRGLGRFLPDSLYV
ncbi:hypothetical protein DPMN_076169 [Dreissena polymorpha]|uniref:Uncharacterized protein n=1 Tax=Dreissena polymorpha TaxID=45954 RepID=A0A9D3YMK5_DREPO|nr:hypothetical protein DPMN_076169 [Dreissena polymorpha]